MAEAVQQTLTEENTSTKKVLLQRGITQRSELLLRKPKDMYRTFKRFTFNSETAMRWVKDEQKITASKKGSK